MVLPHTCTSEPLCRASGSPGRPWWAGWLQTADIRADNAISHCQNQLGNKAQDPQPPKDKQPNSHAASDSTKTQHWGMETVSASLASTSSNEMKNLGYQCPTHMCNTWSCWTYVSGTKCPSKIMLKFHPCLVMNQVGYQVWLWTQLIFTWQRDSHFKRKILNCEKKVHKT